MNLATDLSVTGTEDVTGGIDLSGLVSASSTGGDIVGTFLVYLTRPADDTSDSLQAYLAGRGLIDVDASGKVIPVLILLMVVEIRLAILLRMWVRTSFSLL